MDKCKYVNVFQGCEEIDLPEPEGIARKWFFIKALCGNTSPAATGPYGAMTVSPYTGGYPTGYTNHKVNTHAFVGRFEEADKLRGFTHLNQSGTGAIRFYYNFVLVSPDCGDGKESFAFCDEKAAPGYYSCRLDNGTLCEVTACGKTGAHRYTFDKEGCSAKIDFTQHGLRLPDNSRENQAPCKIAALTEKDGIITAEIKTEGISLYFALCADGRIEISDSSARVFADGKTLNLKIAVSALSAEAAVISLKNCGSFEAIAESSYDSWNEALSRFDINASDEIKEIFYSNLYHSLVKPCDFDGESFVYEKGKPFVTDFSTLWDMYKTQLPLIFMTDKDMGEKIVETILSLGEALGEIPNSFGLNTFYSEHSTQARMLGDYVLITAYRYGVKIDADRMLKVIEKDVFADNKKDFTVDGKCGSNTWMLDMADGCAIAAQIAEERGNKELVQKLIPLAAQWKDAFDTETGVLSSASDYYEGSLYTYSFRPMVSMDERIELAGGKEKFIALIDSFFGYGRPDTIQASEKTDHQFMLDSIAEGRFDGTNNESDMETPYTYVLAGRHDRTCEVVSALMKYMYTTGKGGLPGNNDTGALSSWYCFSALGIFPVAGQDKFIIGTPIIDSADISLFNGKKLRITVENNGEDCIYVEKVSLNGEELQSFEVSAKRLLEGGELHFIKSEKASR